MDFKLRYDARRISDEDLLKDLKRISSTLNKKSVTIREYAKYGNFGRKVFSNRFGSWNNALAKAGLEKNAMKDIPDQELFDNLETVWRLLGRQPLVREMRKPVSEHTAKPYINRYGSWYVACKEFINLKKKDLEFIKFTKVQSRVKTRYISEKNRLRVLKRDHYKCQKCGRSPATHRSLYLHIDHIVPFSNGGSNDENNLQTLCNKCNLGKGNDERV